MSALCRRAGTGMGLNPRTLRQVRAFALTVTPSEPPAVHRCGYRASGLVLTSTPAVRNAQLANIPDRYANSITTRSGSFCCRSSGRYGD
jgi:hypothetical protein